LALKISFPRIFNDGNYADKIASSSHLLEDPTMTMGADQSIVLWQFALNAAWVLLPLVPAVLIYLIFPKTEVTAGGPFAGLTIRASGAFAVYLIVLLATMPLLNRQNHNLEALLRPTWVITGTVQLQDQDGRTRPFNNILDAPKIDIDRRIVEPQGTSGFRIVVPEVADHQIPYLSVSYPNWASYSLDPVHPEEGHNVKINPATKTIDITSPIILRKTECIGLTCEQPS
jgi:hypothetical protein